MHVFYFSLFDQVIDTSSARGGVLECIELSSMVDFSMGTIYLMVGYMTSGHGPLHVLRTYQQRNTFDEAQTTPLRISNLHWKLSPT